jgi:hypothetical protein
MRRLLSFVAPVALVLGLATTAAAGDTVIRIEPGRDYQQYSNAELQHRVWELERAVWQLQQEVYHLQAQSAPPPEKWVCRMRAFGNEYTGTGATKALATASTIEQCKAANNGDGFFCKELQCDQ